MLYINNELIKNLPADLNKAEQDLYKDFCKIFNNNIERGRINPDRPIIIKYKAGMITDDPDNPGKKRMPASITLRYEAYSNRTDGSSVKVQYSPTAARQTKEGLDFRVTSVDVVRGILPVRDFDLAFFFYAFSNQNSERYPDAPHSAFVIENVEAERSERVIKNRENATYTARLWNDPIDGGLSESAIRTAAMGIGVHGANDKTVDGLREEIDSMVHEDKTGSTKKQFLVLTDPERTVAEMKLDEKFSKNKSILVAAMEKNIIQVHHPSSRISWSKPDGSMGELIYNFSDLRKNGDKSKPVDLLLVYLEEGDPEMFQKLKDRLDVKTLASSQV